MTISEASLAGEAEVEIATWLLLRGSLVRRKAFPNGTCEQLKKIMMRLSDKKVLSRRGKFHDHHVISHSPCDTALMVTFPAKGQKKGLALSSKHWTTVAGLQLTVIRKHSSTSDSNSANECAVGPSIATGEGRKEGPISPWRLSA